MTTRLFFRYIVLIFFQAYAVPAEADFSDTTRNRRWYLPHYIPLQFAGNIGFLSTGLGYISNKENYELNILYGYVPPSVGDESIHMVTAKNIFPLNRILTRNNQTIVPYLGLGLMVEVGGDAFFTLPSHYPDGYYDFPKNLHVTAFGGIKMQYLFEDDTTFFRGLEFYAEAGTIDVYVWYKFISHDIKVSEIFSLALGVNFLLDR